MPEQGEYDVRDFFAELQPVPLNPIQKAANAFKEDRRTADHEDPARRKYGLGQGHLYNNKPRPDDVDFDGNPINRNVGDLFTMPSVKDAKKRFYAEDLQDPNSDTYGNPKDSITLALEPLIRKVLFGPNSNLVESGVATIPVPGLADGFDMAWELVQKLHPEIDTVVMGTNGYGAYKKILGRRFKNIVPYQHGTPERTFDMESFEKIIRGVDPKKTVVFLQAAGYNFSAINPTTEQKARMVQILAERGIFPVIDSAYQGLIEGLTKDAELPRIIERETDLPFMVVDSWSKKAQLYGKRVSFIHLATGNQEKAQLARANMYSLIRDRKLSIPPFYKILFHLLNDPRALKQWLDRDLPDARGILTQTRKDLALAMGSERYGHVASGKGMFEKLDISHAGVDALAKDHHIYTVKAADEERLIEDKPAEVARVNMGGIPQDAIDYVAKALKEVLENFPSEKK